MFKLIQRGQVFADCHGWPVIVAGSDAKVVRYWRQGRINTASIDRFNNDFEPLSHEEAQQIKEILSRANTLRNCARSGRRNQEEIWRLTNR
ncbi:DUF4222 domain-containing protein [Klebsiella pneumoniae]